MDLYIRSAALVLITVILAMVLDVQHKVYGTLLGLAACGMLCICLIHYISPVIDLLNKIRSLSGISDRTMSILLKSAGVGLISELSGVICNDSGNASLAKAIRLLGNGVILWLGLPIFDQLLTLLQEVLRKA